MSAFLVFIGGGLGAVLRYLLSLVPAGTTFPLMTLLTNVIGAFCIGFFAAALPSGRALTFLKTGLCGGFTTFSTFSLECLSLFERGAALSGVLYIATSVLGCLAGVWLGKTAVGLL